MTVADSMVSKFAAVSFFAAFGAYLYHRIIRLPQLEEEFERDILNTWSRIVTIPEKRFSTVAIGLNADVDIIVRGSELLRTMNVGPGLSTDHGVLNNIKDLQEGFSFFFARGAGAERHFANSAEFKTIITAAKRLKTTESYIGGNAALMAQKIVEMFPQARVQLTAPVGPVLKTLLSPQIFIPDESVADVDEYHLIMEYQVGEKWGDAVAPVATRFITSSDESNGKLLYLERFFSSLNSKFRPKLVVLSGLHMLDGQPEELWMSRLDVLVDNLKKMPRDQAIHLELASMANPVFLRAIIDQALRLVDSLGLNEQELAFVSRAALGPEASWQGQPEPSEVTRVLRWMLQQYGYNKDSNTESRLTRIHFHCLTFHVVVALPDAWGNLESATAAGTRTAGFQACATADLDTAQVELRMPKRFKLHEEAPALDLDPLAPVSQWMLDGYLYCLSPVLVCLKPLKTVGLGDAISATGLLFSNFTSVTSSI